MTYATDTRNENIFNRMKNGERAKDLAEEYSICTQRIYQIYHKVARKQKWHSLQQREPYRAYIDECTDLYTVFNNTRIANGLWRARFRFAQDFINAVCQNNVSNYIELIHLCRSLRIRNVGEKTAQEMLETIKQTGLVYRQMTNEDWVNILSPSAKEAFFHKGVHLPYMLTSVSIYAFLPESYTEAQLDDWMKQLCWVERREY